MLLFVLAYLFLKFYFFNYFTFLSVFSTPIQLLPTELSSAFQKSQISSPFFTPNNRSAVAVTPGQPGMLPNLQTGKARMAGEPSRRGPQPREALPTTGTQLLSYKILKDLSTRKKNSVYMVVNVTRLIGVIIS